MADWLQGRPEIWRKTSELFKDKAAKEKLWADQAALMGLSVEHIKAWYSAMRDRWVRLNKDKSGQGIIRESDKDAWIREKFEFLRGHVYHQVLRRPVKAINAAKHAARLQMEAAAMASQKSTATGAASSQQGSAEPPSDADVRAGDDDVGGHDPLPPPTPPLPRAAAAAPTLEQQTALFKMTQEMMAQLAPKLHRNPQRNAFGEWVTESLMLLPQDLYRKTAQQIQVLVNNSLDEAAARQPPQQQQQQQQHHYQQQQDQPQHL